jgi:hypothetical protein
MQSGDLFFLFYNNLFFYSLLSFIGIFLGAFLAYFNKYNNFKIGVINSNIFMQTFQVNSSIILAIIYYFLVYKFVLSYSSKLILLLLLIIIYNSYLSSNIIYRYFDDRKKYFMLKSLGAGNFDTIMAILKDVGISKLFVILLINLLNDVNFISLFGIVDDQLANSSIIYYNINYYIYNLLIREKSLNYVEINIILIYSTITVLLFLIYDKTLKKKI